MTTNDPEEILERQMPVVTISALHDEDWEVEVDGGDLNPYETLGMLVAALARELRSFMVPELEFDDDEDEDEST